MTLLFYSAIVLGNQGGAGFITELPTYIVPTYNSSKSSTIMLLQTIAAIAF